MKPLAVICLTNLKTDNLKVEPEVPDFPHQNKQMHAPPMTEPQSLIEPPKFADFVAAFGPFQAVVWLDRFSKELKEACPPTVSHAQTSAHARANIHHICGRAGLIGFAALHAACLAYLEAGADLGDQAEAYEGVCHEAARVLPEIERRRAALV